MTTFVSTAVASSHLDEKAVYKILDFLNRHIEDPNTTDETLISVLNLAKHDYDVIIVWFKLAKYIEKRTDNINNNAWKITTDGQKKLNEISAKEVVENPIASSFKNDLDKSNADYLELMKRNVSLQNSILEIQIPYEKNKRLYSVLTYLGGVLLTLGSIWLGAHISDTKQPTEQPLKLSIEPIQIKIDTISKLDSKGGFPAVGK